jgi:hypothetical protein
MPTGDNSTACPDCWSKLDQNLGEIPSLEVELDTTMARQTASGTNNGPRSAERPLPYNVAASDAIRLLHATLWPWVKEGLDTHPHTPLPYPSTTGMAVALMHLHGWLITHPEGFQAIEEICYACTQARQAIDRAPDRTYAGTCDTVDAATQTPCAEELYAIDGHTTVICPSCSWERDVKQWRYARLEEASDQLLTLSEMTRAVAETQSETIDRKRLENWVRRGRLIRAGHIGAVATYRVGDVLDLLVVSQRRAV